MKKKFNLEKNSFKKGAASFYIVAFSTLILLIVAVSFAMVIISEIDRTTNEDLSQSAYDSALAGIEDAKLAYYSYQNCVAGQSSERECGKIINTIENEKPSCDMVSTILGRGNNSEEGAAIQETNTDNRMQQAYTCVQIRTVLEDYRSTLSSSNQMRVIAAKFADSDKADVNVANEIDEIKISWYTNDGSNHLYSNFSEEGNKVQFPSISTQPLAAPPTISVAMLQTANNFKMSDFDVTVNGKTDRGMVYLVPTDGNKTAEEGKSNFKSSGDTNTIGEDAFSSSNDKTRENLPYTVHCNDTTETEFACSATIELPRPVGGLNGDDTRNPDTFYFMVALPYGGPTTEFAMEFFCKNDTPCAATSRGSTSNSSTGDDMKRAYLDSVQIGIDSTGRANDLFRRLETRLESAADSSYLSLMGPLELQRPDDGGDSLKKDYTVKCEYNFADLPTC